MFFLTLTDIAGLEANVSDGWEAGDGRTAGTGGIAAYGGRWDGVESARSGR